MALLKNWQSENIRRVHVGLFFDSYKMKMYKVWQLSRNMIKVGLGKRKEKRAIV